MIAVGDGAEIGVDEIHQLGEIERKLAIGFDRADIVRPLVVIAGKARIETVPLHHDRVVRGHEVGDVVAAVVRAGVVIAIGRIVDGLVETFAIAVKPVDNRIALSGGGVIWRQEDAEVPSFLEDLAELDAVLNSRLGAPEAQSQRKRAEQKK